MDKQCNLCGYLYTPDPYDFFLLDTEIVIAGKTMNLCPLCLGEFRDWWNHKMESRNMK